MQTAIAAIKVPLKDDHLRRLQKEPQLPKLVLTAIQARETSGAKANPANGHQVERRWTRGRAGRPKEGSQSVSQSPGADNWCEIGPLLARSWPHAWQVMHLRERGEALRDIHI